MTLKEFQYILTSCDIESLELPYQINYFGTTKEVFLDRMRYIINQHRLSWDTCPPEIIPIKKHPNCFTVYLKELDKSIEFLIEETNGHIIRLYNNKTITTVDEADDLTPYDLVFGDDEKPGFNPSDEYCINLLECHIAVTELETGSPKVFTSQQINDWLNRNESLYEYTSINFRFFKFKLFREIYIGLTIIMEDLIHVKVVQKAMKEYQTTLDLNSWLEKYERLYYCKVLCFDQIFSKIDFEKKLIQFMKNSNIFFTGEDFFDIIRFCKDYIKNKNLISFQIN